MAPSVESEQIKQTAYLCLQQPSLLSASAILQAKSPARARLDAIKVLADMPITAMQPHH